MLGTKIKYIKTKMTSNVHIFCCNTKSQVEIIVAEWLLSQQKKFLLLSLQLLRINDRSSDSYIEFFFCFSSGKVLRFVQA